MNGNKNNNYKRGSVLKKHSPNQRYRHGEYLNQKRYQDISEYQSINKGYKMQENEQDINKNNEKKIQEWESLDVQNYIRDYWDTDYDECEKRHKEDI